MSLTPYFFPFATTVFIVLYFCQISGYFETVSHPVASLERFFGAPRRLARERLTWDRIQSGQGFEVGDTIATGDLTFAVIRFHSGEELQLMPRSMVTLRGEPKEVRLEFMAGAGRLKRHTPKAARSMVTITKTPSSNIREHNGETIVKTVNAINPLPEERPPEPSHNEPSVETLALNIEQLTVKEIAKSRESLRKPEQPFSEKSKGEILIVEESPPAPTPKWPPSYTTVDFNKETSLTLEWEIPQDSAPSKESGLTYEITLRTTNHQTAILKTIPTAMSKIEVPDLSTGSYSWSVRSIALDGTRSPSSVSHRLQIIGRVSLSAPKILPTVLKDE